MAKEQTKTGSVPLENVTRLRRFDGPPAAFWSAFVAATGELAGAVKAVLILRDKVQRDRWRKLGDWSSNGHADRGLLVFDRVLLELAEDAVRDGKASRPIADTAVASAKDYAVAVRLQLHQGEEDCVAAFLLLHATEAQAAEALLRVQLVADTPASYQVHGLVQQSRNDVEKFATVLDLLAQVNAERKFMAASLAFCNGLATRYKCDRVSLGWLEGGYVKLKTISRTEKFSRQMEAAKALEVAMEEALDQDDEIVWPTTEGATFIARDHEKFSQEQSVPHLCSVPVRIDDKPVAVVTFERLATPFNQVELQQFRLACDQAARLLSDLHRRDRWFGARMAMSAREQLAKLIGPQHTWAKAVTIFVSALLIALFVVRVNYRVEGDFILRSDEVAYLTAPFDGYIGEASVRTGDTVNKEQAIVKLNTEDMLVEETIHIAEINRYQSEVERARAAGNLAEMRIAQALADQAKSKLAMLRYRLQQAAIKVPFNGVVVEGDLRERLGAPVKQGDALFRVARIDTLFVEVEVNERDVHEIQEKDTGEIAFVTQPKLTFPVRIVRIEPAAVPKKEQNVFLVRCAVEGAGENWWRPGMSGVCKLNVGKRSLIWILTHRTVDFLRLWLWW
ncbi:MAG: efflux RND transporter periplasmic adaptor subunit [Verrucomicrobiota bacterium]